jgi:hypothetical protein
LDDDAGAGIGTGGSGRMDNITINAGMITAISDSSAAGIGCGSSSTCFVNDIVIAGGSVMANSRGGKNISRGANSGNAYINGVIIYGDDAAHNAPKFKSIIIDDTNKELLKMTFDSDQTGMLYYRMGAPEPSAAELVSCGEIAVFRKDTNAVELILQECEDKTIYYVTKSNPEGYVSTVQSITI